MQWMHRGAQHARAAPVALMMAAEALFTQGGCTLVNRMQWQFGGCCCSWMARTRTGSRLEWQGLMIVLSSLRQRLCCDVVGCRGTVQLATV